MKPRMYFHLVLAVLLTAVSSAFADDKTTQDKGTPKEEVVVIGHDKDVSVPSTFGSSTIDNWYVLDNRNIVIETTRRKYKATFMSSCPGIRFTDTIGLSTMGPYQLDKTTTVLLPDGRRCHIKERVPYTAEMEKQGKEEKMNKSKPADKE